MSDHDRQDYIAYRSLSDQFEVRFFGGPLDGAKIVTDIFPDHDAFAHRVLGRVYVYRYVRVSGERFHAHFEPQDVAQQALQTTASRRRVLFLAGLAVIVLTFIACVWSWLL